MADSLSDRYEPQNVEGRIYQWWMDQEYFRAEDRSTKPPYSIILPPPNVTGHLHLGHALDHTIQDTLIRWRRMSGFNALWLPGTDHAGIATQSVVEKELRKEGTDRHELGREEFEKRVWDWKETYGSRIVSQMKRLGGSYDWSRLCFTLDPEISQAVRQVFVSLYKKGSIYRGKRLINWSPKLRTALSDLEVEHEVKKGHIWHIRYPLVGSDDQLTVATTRPETLLGDTAVCVHPNDERYQSLIGKEVDLPLTDRKIPIIADEYVDPSFGSGVVKITPAHDFNDYEVGKRHNLEAINILNEDGTLNKVAGKYQGLTVVQARQKVIEDLTEHGLLEKEEPHEHSVGHCSRSGCVVEPYLSDQWFVKMEELAGPAKRVVESGTTVFEPDSWTKTYLHWLDIIEDWCISRQLWWGHRIPAWYCEDCDHITVEAADPSECEKCQSKKIKQEEDVLDTWFSSALWPFTTLGWPKESEAQKTFYPTSTLVTGHDIIFFWVARMMMMGLEFKKDVPFRKVIIHGLVRDAQGRKMSKSLGNSLDPVELIDKYGADALRFSIMAQIASGRDLKFSEKRLEGYRNFMNKIWNAARFALKALDGFVPPSGEQALQPQKAHLSVYDQWITAKLAELEETVQAALENDRFSDAANSIYSFVWHEFCDWYLEFSKTIIYGDQEEEKQTTQLVLAQTLNRLMRLLHPFAPFITEEIYQKLPIRSESVMVAEYPTIENDREWLEVGAAGAAEEVELVKHVITALRNIRGENSIKPNVEIKAHLAVKDDASQKVLGDNKSVICKLTKVNDCQIGPIESVSKCAVTPVVYKDYQVDVVVPLSGLVDFDAEIQRLEKSIDKLQKQLGSLAKKLENENFLNNAPGEIVEKDRQLMNELDGKIQQMQVSLGRLRN